MLIASIARSRRHLLKVVARSGGRAVASDACFFERSRRAAAGCEACGPGIREGGWRPSDSRFFSSNFGDNNHGLPELVTFASHELARKHFDNEGLKKEGYLAYGFKEPNNETMHLLSFGAASTSFPMDEVILLSETLGMTYVDAVQLPKMPGSYALQDRPYNVFNAYWREYYCDAMELAETMTFIITEAWIQSPHCWNELKWATERRKDKRNLIIYQEKGVYEKLHDTPTIQDKEDRYHSWKDIVKNMHYLERSGATELSEIRLEIRKIFAADPVNPKSEIGSELQERSVRMNIIKALEANNIKMLTDLHRMEGGALDTLLTKEEASTVDREHVMALWMGVKLDKKFVPPVRKQCMRHGIGPKDASILEKNGVLSLDNLSEMNVRKFQRSNPSTPISQLRHAASSARKETRRENELTRMQLISEAKEKELESAKNILSRTKEQLEGMNVSATNAENSEKLKEALTSLKDIVKEPLEMKAVGKSLLGHDGLLEKLDTKSLFEASASNIKNFEKDKDLFAAASGGMALNGISLFMDINDPFASSTLPMLAPPDYVETMGVFTPFISTVFKTTQESDSASFENAASTFGMSIAEESSQSMSGSASLETPFIKSNVAHGNENENQNSSGKETEDTNKQFHNSTTQSVYFTEYIKMPMQTFRIHPSEMKLSLWVLSALEKVRSPKSAETFLLKFGSHVSTGRHTFGGVFFRKITLHTTSETNTLSMLRAAGEVLTTEKNNSNSTEASAGGGSNFVTGSVGASYSKATSSGTKEVKSKAEGGGDTEVKKDSYYESSVRCMGPNATTPEEFAKILSTNRGTWACIDRGDTGSLLPIWELLEDEGAQNHNFADDLRGNLHNSWFRLASDWNPKSDKDLWERTNFPRSLKNLVANTFRSKDKGVEFLESLFEYLQKLVSSEDAPDDEMRSLLFFLEIIKKASAKVDNKGSRKALKTNREKWIDHFLFLGCDNDQEKEKVQKFIDHSANIAREDLYFLHEISYHLSLDVDFQILDSVDAMLNSISGRDAFVSQDFVHF